MQRKPGRNQGSSQRTEFERTYFTRLKDSEESPWSQVQLFSSVDALQTYFRLVCHRHDILPLAGPDIDHRKQKKEWTRWHWADFEITDYYATTIGDGARAVRCDTVKTLHHNDDTVVTSLVQKLDEVLSEKDSDEELSEEDRRLTWGHAKKLRGNPPPSEYPAVVHRKRQRTVALYVLTRPREEFTINPLFPRRPAILYEDRDQEQWFVLREPLAFSEHAANHLRTSKDTPGTWSYGGLLQKGYEHVKTMICQDAQKNQLEKIVVKDIGIHSTEKPCDPTELVDEPREIYLNRKLKKVVAGMIPSILQMDSVSYQHSDRRAPWKLCMLLIMSVAG
jgi:hypothetical protein